MAGAILMYHRIANEEGDTRYTVNLESFRRQMDFLKARDYFVAPLRDMVRTLKAGHGLPKNLLAITFDDGFESTFDHAVPILRGLRFTATFFLVTKLIGRTNEWVDSKDSSEDRLLSWDQAVELHRQGFELGSHTCSHPRLTEVELVRARMEIVDSKQELESHISAPVSAFAYPFGAFDDRVRDLVRAAGYDFACSTMSGFNGPELNLFSLRRIDVFGTDSLNDFQRKLDFGSNRVTSGEVARYYLQRVAARIRRK